MPELPDKVRITEDHDDFKVGEEYEIHSVVLAGGYVFYEPKQLPEEPVQLISATKCGIIK